MSKVAGDETNPGDSERPGLWRMFRVFFRAGLLTFGGGYAMLPVLDYELVRARNWMDRSAFTAGISKATAVPGPVAVNSAFLFGRDIHGVSGSVVAVFGVTLPSVMVMLAIAAFMVDHMQHPVVMRFMMGAAAAVSAQIAYGALIYAKVAVRSIYTVLVALVLLAALIILEVHPLLVIVAAFAVGLPRARLRAGKERS
ncbi:MAG: chromate transporter [Spirochaetales bacterium]